MTTPFVHRPVMLAEILEVFEPLDGGVFVDATVGGGGHSGALLDAHPSLRLVGLDRDRSARAAARATLARHGDRAVVVRARFDELAGVLDRLAIDEIVGVLFDLGVSSHQLDTAERGFSFRHDGPLDMRMDADQTTSAADLVNALPADALAGILRDLGDERHAARIARAIVAARPIASTAALAAVVVDAMPAASRRTPGHPARRTFQALRIAVNDELDVLAPALDAAITRMAAGGRGAVLTYHSGEDRIVKQRLKFHADDSRDVPRGLPVAPESTALVRLLGRGGRTPTATEVQDNPRASAARLRAFERTAVLP